MTRWLKLAVLLVTVGLSACLIVSPTQTTSEEGQVMSVTAIDVSVLPVDAGSAVR